VVLPSDLILGEQFSWWRLFRGLAVLVVRLGKVLKFVAFLLQDDGQGPELGLRD
jgi:hypothetical protein